MEVAIISPTRSSPIPPHPLCPRVALLIRDITSQPRRPLRVVSPQTLRLLDKSVEERSIRTGTWSLRVYDRAGGDVGTINSWTLHLPAQTNTCTSLSNSIIVTELPAVTVSGFFADCRNCRNPGDDQRNRIYRRDCRDVQWNQRFVHGGEQYDDNGNPAGATTGVVAVRRRPAEQPPREQPLPLDHPPRCSDAISASDMPARRP